MIIRTAATILAAMTLALSATLAGAQDDATPVATEQLAVPALPDPEQFCVYSGQLYSKGALIRPEKQEFLLSCQRAMAYRADDLPNPLSWEIVPEQDQAAAN